MFSVAPSGQPQRQRLRAYFLARPLRAALVVWSACVVVLLGYCLIHSLVTDEEHILRLSLVWSLVHATGISCLLLWPVAVGQRAWLWQVLVPGIALVVSSGLGLLLHLLLGWHWLLPDFVSVTLYCLLGWVCVLYWYQPGRAAVIWADIRQVRQVVSLDQVLAVHGAKNYLELDIQNQSSCGLIRMSMADFIRQHSESFIQVHRSHLVAPVAIVGAKQLSRKQLVLVLVNGSEIPVGDKFLENLKQIPELVPVLADLSH